jgi:hypothetical protein
MRLLKKILEGTASATGITRPRARGNFRTFRRVHYEFGR